MWTVTTQTPLLKSTVWCVGSSTGNNRPGSLLCRPRPSPDGLWIFTRSLTVTRPGSVSSPPYCLPHPPPGICTLGYENFSFPRYSYRKDLPVSHVCRHLQVPSDSPKGSWSQDLQDLVGEVEDPRPGPLRETNLCRPPLLMISPLVHEW